jgi:hypothetical protein
LACCCDEDGDEDEDEDRLMTAIASFSDSPSVMLAAPLLNLSRPTTT